MGERKTIKVTMTKNVTMPNWPNYLTVADGKPHPRHEVDPRETIDIGTLSDDGIEALVQDLRNHIADRGPF